MRPSILPRLLITLLGLALVFVGTCNIMLWLVGEPATAVITNIRREGGERTDPNPGRYTYNISYTFTLPDGREINGLTKKIGDSVYLKADGTSKAAVRYFKAAPFINNLQENVNLSLGQLILAGAGIFLIVVINRKAEQI